MLDAAAQAHEAVVDACGLSFGGRHTRMGHGGRMTKQAFDTAEAFGEFEELGLRHEGLGRFQPVVMKAKAQNTSEQTLLLLRNSMIVMAFQSRIMHFGDGRMTL